jgi:hypothetical protein
MPQMQTKRDTKSAHAVPIAPRELPTTGTQASAVNQLAAILAQYTIVGHVYLEISIGPEMAQAMLDRNFNNRPLRETRAKIMARAMLENRYRAKVPHPICFDIEGVMRDGQHRLRAVILSGCVITFTVCFGCDPAERDYYDQGISRSVADIAREHGHLNVMAGQALVALILRIELQEPASLDRNKLTERLDELYGTDPDFDMAIKTGMRLRLFVTPSASGLAYWTIAHGTARRDRLDAFWEAMVSGANLPPRSPVLRVREHFRAATARSTRDVAVKAAAAIIIAWNGLIERRNPRHFRWDSTVRLPEVV